MSKALIYLMLTLSVVYVLGFVAFINLAQAYWQANRRASTDAIIVLTGGRNRIETGVDLLRQNYSEKLFITGVDSKVKSVPKVIEIYNALPKSLQTKIEFGQTATNTFENAIEAGGWIRSHGIQSITLVTSIYHMPRSLLEFSKALPDVRIEAHPSVSQSFHISDWWLGPSMTLLLFKEYNKYLIVKARTYYEKYI